MTRPTLAGFKKKALKNAEVRAEYEAREHITRPGPPSLSEECVLPVLCLQSKRSWEGETMTTLKKEIDAFERMRDDLETECYGKWVVVRDEQLIGTYESFELAADDAVKRFGRGPYLIREVGAGPTVLPASVLYRPVHA